MDPAPAVHPPAPRGTLGPIVASGRRGGAGQFRRPFQDKERGAE